MVSKQCSMMAVVLGLGLLLGGAAASQEACSATTQAFPSLETTRDLAFPIQQQLYNQQSPSAVLLVVNRQRDPASAFATIRFQGHVQFVAPANSFARIETSLHSWFQVSSPPAVLNVEVTAPLVCVELYANHTLALVEGEGCVDRPVEYAPTLTTGSGVLAKCIKIKNLSNKRLNRYWVNGQNQVYNGVLEPHSIATTNSYVGHRFHFFTVGKQPELVYELTVTAGEEIYAHVEETTAEPEMLSRHLEEVQFAAKYKETRRGRPWLSYYPKLPAQTFMWPAEFVGQRFALPNRMTLVVESVSPKVYSVDAFLTHDECDEIVSKASRKLAESSEQILDDKGQRVLTTTRTSTNAWLRRSEVDLIYRRVAELLNVDEGVVSQDVARGGRAEAMQVVHYAPGQHYVAHHDFGVHNSPNTRFATVLLYLNNVTEGGDTYFPKANHHLGLSVKPVKGKAVLFYSQFPDGNCDDSSLHQANAVVRGEKWLANVWLREVAQV